MQQSDVFFSDSCEGSQGPPRTVELEIIITIIIIICFICTNRPTVVGMNLCVRRPLEVKGKGIGRVVGVADKEVYTVDSINIFFPAAVLRSSLSQFLSR
jgi:hypothetical protein